MSTPNLTGFHISTQHGALHKYAPGYSFNGSNEFVPLPSTWGHWHELTVEAWIKTNGPTGDFQAILSSNELSFAHIQIFSAGNISIYTDTGAVVLPIIPDIPANIWRHITVIAKSGASKVIVDGEQVGETNTHLFNHITSSSEVTIGRGYNNARYFNGEIAGLRIHHDARSHEDIHAETFNYLLDKPSLTVVADHSIFGFKSIHGKFMSAQPDGTIVADRDWLRGWEKFEIVDAGGGKVGLKSIHGKFVSAQPNGTLEANRDWLRGWEKFNMVITAANQVGFKSHFGKYISAQPNGTLEVNRDWLRGWEKFEVVKG